MYIYDIQQLQIRKESVGIGMANKSKEATKNFIVLLSNIIPTKKKLIVVDKVNYSGSNLYFLDESYYESQLNSFNIIRLDKVEGNKFFLFLIKVYFYRRSSILLTTHGFLTLPKKNQIFINLWHGFPIKAMERMQNFIKNAQGNRCPENVIYISSSVLFETFLSSMIFTSKNNFKLLGNPRNDLLFRPQSIPQKIEASFEKSKKNILLALSWNKKGLQSELLKSLIENVLVFDDFLLENNFKFFIKPHPNEENYYKKMVQASEVKSIIFLDDATFKTFSVDFYSVLNRFDLLVTDHSSISFDFMLLNRPIIYDYSSVDSCRLTEGLLIHDYKFWMPGPMVESLDELMHEILSQIQNDDYTDLRRSTLDQVHFYKDENSTQRFIDTIFIVSKVD